MKKIGSILNHWIPPLLTASMLWLPVFLCELIHPDDIREIAASSVLQKKILLSLALTLIVIAVIGSASAIAGLVIVIRGRKSGTTVDTRLDGCTMAALASALLIWRPAIEYLGPWIVLILCLIVSFTFFYLVHRVCPSKVRANLCWILFLASIITWMSCWVFSEGHPLDDPLGLAVLSGALGAVLVMVYASLDANQRHWRVAAVLAGSITAIGGPLGIALLGAEQTPSEKPYPPPQGRGPNVLIFMVDTLRADHMSLYGYNRNTTPKISQAATERTTVFTQAQSGATHTIPSVKSLFTSMSPSNWGFEGASNEPPPVGQWNLPAAFDRAGYDTVCISANELISGPGFEQGFNEYWSMGGFGSFRESFLLHKFLCEGDHFKSMRLVDRLHLHKVHGKTVVDIADRWFARKRERPFFMYLHFLEPHWPFYDRSYGLATKEMASIKEPLSHVDLIRLPKKDPGNKRYWMTDQLAELVSRYDEEIRRLDELFDLLMQRLEERGLRDSTMILLVGDHGEEFFEHSSFSHGHDIFVEQSHIPCVVFWPIGPEYSDMPKAVHTPVSLLDISPTLIDLLDLPQPREPLAGRSLRALLEGRPDPQPVMVESYYGDTLIASYREDQLVARICFNRRIDPSKSGKVSVFDLKQDPHQMKPLPDSDARVPPFLERARAALLERWISCFFEGMSSDQAFEEARDQSEEALEQLRAMGYIK